MNSQAKKQWAAWIKQRSKVHAASQLPCSAPVPNSAVPASRMIGREDGSYHAKATVEAASKLMSLRGLHVASPGDTTFGQQARQIVSRLSKFSLQKDAVPCEQASKILTCMSHFQLGRDFMPLTRLLVDAVLERTYELNSEGIFPVVLAIGVLNPPDVKDVLTVLAPRIVQLAEELLTMEIAAVAFAYSRAKVYHEALLDTLTAVFTCYLSLSTVQECINMVTALERAKYKGKCKSMVHEIGTYVTKKLLELRLEKDTTLLLTTKEAVACMRAFSGLGYRDRQVYDACSSFLSAAPAEGEGSLEPPQVVEVLWAMQRAPYYNSTFTQRMVLRAVGFAPSLPLWDVGRCLYALAILGHPPSEAFATLGDRAVEILKTRNPNLAELSMLLSAYTLVEYPHAAVERAIQLLPSALNGSAFDTVAPLTALSVLASIAALHHEDPSLISKLLAAAELIEDPLPVTLKAARIYKAVLDTYAVPLEGAEEGAEKPGEGMPQMAQALQEKLTVALEKCYSGGTDAILPPTMEASADM